MLIVDAQIHLWNAGNPTSPWHRQIPAYLKEDALKEMDAGGVDAAILTPHTPWDPNANELCMEAVRAHPDRFAILGNFPSTSPRAARWSTRGSSARECSAAASPSSGRSRASGRRTAPSTGCGRQRSGPACRSR